MTESSQTPGILIVDDEKGVRSSFSLFLKSRGFTNVMEAADGTECLAAIARQGSDIHLVLLDLKMPKMDGIKVMEYLVNECAHVIGIIIITGYRTVEAEKRFFRLGTGTVLSLDFLQKPIDPQRVVDRVEEAMCFIAAKRAVQSDSVPSHLPQLLEASSERNRRHLSGRLDQIDRKLDRVLNHQRSFLSNLGLDVIRVILISLLVIAALYFGVDDFIRRIVQGSP